MTHRDHRNEFEFEVQSDSSAPGGFHEVLELLVDHGFDGLAQAMQTLFNEAMKLERSQVLGARPYERTSDRRGYGNGYKAKTVRMRVCGAGASDPAGSWRRVLSVGAGARDTQRTRLVAGGGRDVSARCFDAQSDRRDGAALRSGSHEHAGQPCGAGSG